MSKEKHIEEMLEAQCVYYGECEHCPVYPNDKDQEDKCRTGCRMLYEAGYRKQSEGEWIIKSEIYKLLDDVDEELYVECSICQRRFNVPYELDDERIFKYAREHYPYCNCGAKMKGGAE